MEKIKKILNIIWKVLNSKFFYFSLIILLFIFYLNKCNKFDNLERENIKKEQNLDALNDSIKKIKKKNGNLEFSISGLIANEKELKNLNNKLYDDLKNQKGKVITLNRANIQLKQDKNELEKYVNILEKKLGEFKKINDSTYSTTWSLTYRYDSTNYDIFKGRTIVGVIEYPFNLKHIDTDLEYRESQIDLSWGQKIEDDKLRIFAESKHPSFNLSSLEGVLIDPKNNKYLNELMGKKHWFTGFSVGPNIDLGYDIINQRTSIIIGAGIQYNIYHW